MNNNRTKEKIKIPKRDDSMKSKKHYFFIINIVCTSLLLSGCWSYRELTDIAFVIAIGIDEGEKQPYKLSFQLINPKNVAGEPQKSGIIGPATVIYQSEGDNLFTANRATTQQVSRRLYYAHTSLVVISEKLARKGIRDVLDILTRSPEFRPTADIVIAKDSSAEDLLNVLTPLDQINADKIQKTLKYSEQLYGKTTKTNINDIVSELISNGNLPIISGFKIEGDRKKAKSSENILNQKPLSTIHADSIALFKNEKLVTWAEGAAARGINWILGNTSQPAVNIDWADKKGAISIQILRSNSQIKTEVKNNKPIITINLKAEGNVAEVNTYLDLSREEEFIKLQSELEKVIKNEINEAIKLGKKYKTDVFSFGDHIRISHPKYWKKVQDHWNDDILPTAEIKINVDASLRLTGLKTKSDVYQ